MDQDIKTQLDEQSKKIDAMYISVEKTRRYFLITMWVTLLAIVLPLVGLAFLAPSMLDTYSSILGGTQ